MKILGQWVRPWREELVVGVAMAVSGDHVICQTANGFTFLVALEDVFNFKVKLMSDEEYFAGKPVSYFPKALPS